jgi:hypothetical protein
MIAQFKPGYVDVPVLYAAGAFIATLFLRAASFRDIRTEAWSEFLCWSLYFPPYIFRRRLRVDSDDEKRQQRWASSNYQSALLAAGLAVGCLSGASADNAWIYVS